jgi:TetR/AcrR family transcriptional regulator, regulator of cefoperazone and chloramphenicol sensitivity
MKRVPRRRPKAGGYARGDETRAQIITTALKVFGERGFDQASTRDIAAKAGVKTPALQYYFDSKEGLHRACAQHIIDRALPTLKPSIDRAKQSAPSGSKEIALEALEELLDALTDSLADPSTDSWSRFIMRGKHDGAGPGMEMIRDELSYPILEAVTGLVASITGFTSVEINRIRTLLILGQIHWMNARREEVFRIMHWSRLDTSKLALIKQTVREHTRLVLNGIGTMANISPSKLKQSTTAAVRSAKVVSSRINH